MRPVLDPVIPEFVKKYQIVDGFHEIEEIMKSPDFTQGGQPERETFLRGTLIYLEGNEHRDTKNLLSPLMSRDSLAYYELHLLDPVITETLANLRHERDEDGLVRTDLVPLLRIMLRQISARVTGADGVDTPERIERFGALAAKVGAASSGQFATDRPQVIAEGKEALLMLIDEFLQASLDRRKQLVDELNAGKISKETLPRDMLMTLCLANDLTRPDDADAEIPYVWRQCTLFLNASMQTTSHMLPHVFVHLDEWIAEHPDDKPKLRESEFLRKAVGESMRLHQTSPVRFRIADRDVTLSTGRKVKAGEMLALYAPPANLETSVFGPDARYFNPYREVPQGQMPWGMTFGSGIHMCLGRNLVTGIRGKSDSKFGNDGTALKIVKTLYAYGCELDPENPPKRWTASYHDAYESVPVILRDL